MENKNRKKRIIYKVLTGLVAGMLLLISTGCQRNSTKKSSEDSIKISKRSKRNSSHKQSSSESKHKEKLPTASELMANAANFNRSDYLINIKGNGTFSGSIQLKPFLNHYNLNDKYETWAGDQDVYVKESDGWIKMNQTGKNGYFFPIRTLPSSMVQKMQVKKSGSNYIASFSGNSEDAKQVLQPVIAKINAMNMDPFEGDSLNSSSFTYTFNSSKELIAISINYVAGSHSGSLQYSNINQIAPLSVPSSVVNEANNNAAKEDTDNNTNNDIDVDSDDE